MALYADRVKDSTSITGTGAVTLSGTAPTGYQTFATAFGSTALTVAYCIQDQPNAITGIPGPNWEVGTGVFNGTTGLTRVTVLASSNAGALVSFTGGTQDVFCTAPAAYLSLAPVALTYGATVSPVSGTKIVYRVVLTGNITINAPSSATDGDQVEFWLTASGGARTVTFSFAHIPSSSTLTSPVTIASGTQGELMFRYDATLGAWKAARFVNGYT